jgi:acetyl esterase/lipase
MKFSSVFHAMFGAVLAALLPLSGIAGSVQALWPEAGMPDAQSGVAAPFLEWSDAPASKVGSCVIIVASGDYASTDSVAALSSLEEKLLANGVTCVWLHSRPSASGLAAYKVALEDAQRAVRLVRQAATERGYSADKIGVMGFADGAHLSLLLATSSLTPAYTKVDSVDDIACNVNFAIPMSPTRVLASGTALDTVFAFDNKTCTMCLFHGQDDAVTSPIATTRIYRKLRTMTVSNGAKVPSEIHLIPGRGHDLVTASEFDRAVEFMCQSGFLGTLGAEVQLNSRFPNDNDRATYTKVSLWPEGKTPNYQSAQNEPYLEWHMPKELNTRAVQILYAGGAYGFNNPQDFEVTPLRRYLNAKGMAVVTIKYRCPRPEGLAKHMSAWQDLQRTIRLVRDEAPRRGLDPNSIGIMGCSAGGHLTLMGATTSQTAAYARIDEVDDLPCNVKWAIAIYPAYALTDGADGENTNGGNLDTDVLVNDFAFDASTCNMLFMHGDADSYAAMNSVKCWEKLRTMNIESELHTLATRRHTFQQNASPGTTSYNINDIIWEYVDDFAAAAVAPEAVDGQPSGDQSGITDTKMIQDLIDAAAPTHGTVELSAGTFYVNAQLNVTNGVTLVGQGWTNTVIKQVSTPNWNETARCAVVDGGAKIEGFALTGGYIKNANDCGAGVWVKNGTVSWCCITNNVGGHHYASGYGVSFSGGQGAIDHSIIANNVSASGFQGGSGAGLAVNATTGAVTIDTCLVVGNVTANNGASGGGVYVKDLAGNCTVRNCTITGNKAVANAGGIDIASASGAGKLVLVNSIVAGNKVGDAEGNLRTNTSFFDPVNSKNCFVGLASETKTNIGGVNYDLTGFKSGDPKFVDPSNGNYRLQEDSPANGAGATYDGIGNDLDGKAFAAPPSIGCYEYGVGEPPAPHTHDWGAPSYSWASDNSTCTATAVCTENSSHVTNETVTASYQVVQAATTEAAGTGRYTATFSSALFSTQTKDVVIPQLNPGPGPEPADAIQPGASASANRLTIQDAIDAAAPTHGTVTLGSGVFEIDAQLNVTGGVTLVGQGWENTVVKQVTTPNYGANARCVMIDDEARIEGVALTGGTIKNTGDGGAGAWIRNGTVSWCCITNNVGAQHNVYGCGVSFSGGQGTIDHSIIADNIQTGGASFYGGGIGALDTAGPVTVDTCLIARNSLTSGAGGGIGIKNLGGDCVVRNCTVVGNTANTHSAGIRIENRAAGNSTAVGVMINTIVVGNMKSGAEVNYADNYVVDKTNSSNCFFGLADEAALFADSLSGDPKFVTAANGDYRLSGESAAKNAGVAYSGIGVDLEGVAFAAAPSIGCYEYDPNAVPPPSPAEWDIPGASGGIKALDDGDGVKYVVFTSIALDGSALTVGFAAGKVDGNGQVFGLLCKTDLADTATFTINATLSNGASDTLGTLSAVLDQSYSKLFVVGIGPAAE